MEAFKTMPIGIDLSTMPMGGFTFPIQKGEKEKTKDEVPFTPSLNMSSKQSPTL